VKGENTRSREKELGAKTQRRLRCSGLPAERSRVYLEQPRAQIALLAMPRSDSLARNLSFVRVVVGTWWKRAVVTSPVGSSRSRERVRRRRL